MISNITLNTELILSRIGSTWFYDSFYLFILTPLSFAGVILNTINVICLTKIIRNNKAAIKLFILLRIYCLNAISINFIGIFLFFYSPKYTGVFTDYFTRVYRCIISNYVILTLYFYGNILDIIILHDRLIIFIPKIDVCKQIGPRLKCLIAFLLCIMIELPSLSRYTIKSDEELFSNQNLTNRHISGFYCKKWLDFKSLVVLMIIKDILTLFIQLIQTLLSLFYFRKFKNNKKSIISVNCNSNSRSSTSTSSSKFKSSNSIQPNNHNKKSKKLSSSKTADETNLTFSTLFLTFLSVACHLAVNITVFVSIDQFDLSLFFISVSLITFKNFSNFIIFYFSNKTFKKTFISFFH